MQILRRFWRNCLEKRKTDARLSADVRSYYTTQITVSQIRGVSSQRPGSQPLRIGEQLLDVGITLRWIFLDHLRHRVAQRHWQARVKPHQQRRCAAGEVIDQLQ